MKERLFRFKQFAVSHSRSAQKVGVDGVLIGAWTEVPTFSNTDSGYTGKVLDVGCGCGLIALMIAQRMPHSRIDAIDIHADSVAEARENFIASPWGDRLEAIQADFTTFSPSERYDLIVSNPPFFASGVNDPSSPRLVARHVAGLSPLSLIERAPSLLTPGGSLSLIATADMLDDIREAASKAGLTASRLCRVKGNATAPCKRVMLQFERNTDTENRLEAEITEIILESAPGVRTSEYAHLCGDYYL